MIHVKKLGTVIFGAIDEYNMFSRFNSFLVKLKKRFAYIIAVVPEKAITILSEAYEIISASNEYLNKKGANYPDILNIMNGSRNISDFYQKALQIAKTKYPDYQILYYAKTMDHVAVDENDIPIFPELTKQLLGDAMTRDYQMTANWLKNNNLLYPTKETFSLINNKYSSIFEDDTFIIMTRNFSDKQPEHNTQIKYEFVKDFIEFMTNKGYKIINLGFPPSPFKINSNLYLELYDKNLTQDEIMSLFYLSKGIFVSHSGLPVHICCNANIFNYTPEHWVSLVEARQNNNKVSTFDVKDEMINKDFESILNKINQVRQINKIFSERKKIYWVE